MQQQQKEKQNSAKNKYINTQPSLLTKRTEIRILYIITFCISLYIIFLPLVYILQMLDMVFIKHHKLTLRKVQRMHL
jgi:hypothetical protein